MHYKNGREAKNGDKVIHFGYNNVITSGILYDAIPGNDYCNGKIAVTRQTDLCPNLKECLHANDVVESVAQLPSSFPQDEVK